MGRSALKPEYNIVKLAGSTLGYKHTPESLEKMRSFILSDEVRERKAKSTENATASRRVPIIVENIETNEIMEFISLTEASKSLNVTKGAISQAFINNTLVKKKYTIKKKLY